MKELINASERDIELSTAKGSNLIDDPVQVDRVNVFGVTATIDDKSPEQLLDEAVALALNSDIVLLAVGEAKEHAGECSSRTDPQMPACQRRLIAAVAATGRPVILVIFAGRPLILTDVVDQAESILYAWYGGVMSGPAIADVLFGNINPSARLTMSFPRSVGQIPVHHDALPTGRPLPKNTAFEKFKSCYLDEPNSPLFPFGFGLSYSEVRYGEPSASRAGQRVEVRVPVTNRGDRACSEVVQCYCTREETESLASTSPPMLMLVAYRKIELMPGEKKLVVMSIDKQCVAMPEGDKVADINMVFRSGRYRLSVGPNSESLQSTSIDW